MWRIWCAPNNASKGQMEFDTAFKEIIYLTYLAYLTHEDHSKITNNTSTKTIPN